MIEPGTQRSDTVQHGTSLGSVLSDPAPWLAVFACAAAGAVAGLWFGPSIGESKWVGAVALGIMGLAPGFVVGLALALIRRRSRRHAAELAARERFVASLNEQAPSGHRMSIDPEDPRVLITEYIRSAAQTVDPEVLARLRASLSASSADYSAAKSELRRHGFSKWLFRVNGETILEHRVD